MLNRSCSLLLALLFLPILLSLSLYLFLLEVVWNFSPSSVQSFLSAQGHLCLSAWPQWGLFVASCWSLPLLPSVEKCVLGSMDVCASSPYFFRLSSVIPGPPFAFWPGRHPSGWLWNEAKTQLCRDDKRRGSCFIIFYIFFCLKQEVANTHTQRLAQTEMSDLFLSDVKYLIHTHPLTSALPPSPRFFYFIFIMQFSLFLMGARQWIYPG